MLLSTTTQIKWNSKNKKRYVDLGYNYTKMGDLFTVNVNDLTDNSTAPIYVVCDYCNQQYETKWRLYLHGHINGVVKDCCNNPKCIGKKSTESLIKKYGTRNIFEIPEIKEKLITTNIKRFGCENPFSNEDIKNKIVETNLNKYGVKYTMQNPDTVLKSQKTCMKRYGTKNYGAIYSKEHTKELSPTWKGGVNYSREERATYEYNQWRKNIFKRDKYTCQCCGSKNGFGKTVVLESHHILNWKNNESKRYDIDNGITLCKECHKNFHSKYGKKNNNKQQLNDFINSYYIDEKIC